MKPIIVDSEIVKAKFDQIIIDKFTDDNEFPINKGNRSDVERKNMFWRICKLPVALIHSTNPQIVPISHYKCEDIKKIWLAFITAFNFIGGFISDKNFIGMIKLEIDPR